MRKKMYIFIWLLIFPLDSFVGSANGLDSTDVKSLDPMCTWKVDA